VAVASPLGAVVRLRRLTGSRATVRERAAQTALDLLRRHLLELPIDATLD
jgi:nicotinamide mononucleotide (NMN) deamidase PncC